MAESEQETGPKEVPEWVRAKLEKYAARTVQFLNDLTDAKQVGPDMVKVPAMPKSAIGHSQGLAIITRQKGGLLLSATHERGYILGKVTTPDGFTVWSGPVFTKGASYGLGLTLGRMKSRLCLALMNEKSLERATQPKRDFGLSWQFLLDMDASRVKGTSFDSSLAGPSQILSDASGGMLAKYYIVEAAMIDVSIRAGGVRLDDALNAAVYGSGVNVADVLKCKVPPPAEFQPVHVLLHRLEEESRAKGSANRDRSAQGTRPVGRSSGSSAEREMGRDFSPERQHQQHPWQRLEQHSWPPTPHHA